LKESRKYFILYANSSMMERSLFIGGLILLLFGLIYTPNMHHYMMMGPYYLAYLPVFFTFSGFVLVIYSLKDIIREMKPEIRYEKRNELELVLKLLNKDEAEVLKIIYENEGITQDSIHFRTGFSHSKVSMIIKKLEEKDLIYREKFGKTYKCYLSDWFKRSNYSTST